MVTGSGDLKRLELDYSQDLGLFSGFISVTRPAVWGYDISRLLCHSRNHGRYGRTMIAEVEAGHFYHPWTWWSTIAPVITVVPKLTDQMALMRITLFYRETRPNNWKLLWGT